MSKKTNVGKKKATQDTYQVVGQEVVFLEEVELADTHRIRPIYQETVDHYADIMVGYCEAYKEWSKKKSKEPEPEWPFKVPRVIKHEWEKEGNRYYCYEAVTGNHTVAAAKQAGLEEIEVEVIEGSEKALKILAIQDNSGHGRPYSKEEIKNNIIELHVCGCPYRKIIEATGVSIGKISNIVNAFKNEQNGGPGPEEKKAPKSFNPEAHLKKVWAPFVKHPEAFTQQAVSGFAQAVAELHGILDQHGLGEDFLEQIEMRLWSQDGESDEDEDAGNEDEEDFGVEEEENMEEEEEDFDMQEDEEEENLDDDFERYNPDDNLEELI